MSSLLVLLFIESAIRENVEVGFVRGETQALPQNARGVLFDARVLDDEARFIGDTLVFRAPPMAPRASDFRVTDETTKRRIEVKLARVASSPGSSWRHAIVLGEPRLWRCVREPLPIDCFDQVPFFRDSSRQEHLSWWELVSNGRATEVKRGAGEGRFLVMPLGGFKAGHRYLFEWRRPPAVGALPLTDTDAHMLSLEARVFIKARVDVGPPLLESQLPSLTLQGDSLEVRGGVLSRGWTWGLAEEEKTRLSGSLKLVDAAGHETKQITVSGPCWSGGPLDFYPRWSMPEVWDAPVAGLPVTVSGGGPPISCDLTRHVRRRGAECDFTNRPPEEQWQEAEAVALGPEPSNQAALRCLLQALESEGAEAQNRLVRKYVAKTPMTAELFEELVEYRLESPALWEAAERSTDPMLRQMAEARRGQRLLAKARYLRCRLSADEEQRLREAKQKAWEARTPEAKRRAAEAVRALEKPNCP